MYKEKTHCHIDIYSWQHTLHSKRNVRTISHMKCTVVAIMFLFLFKDVWKQIKLLSECSLSILPLNASPRKHVGTHNQNVLWWYVRRYFCNTSHALLLSHIERHMPYMHNLDIVIYVQRNNPWATGNVKKK